MTTKLNRRCRLRWLSVAVFGLGVMAALNLTAHAAVRVALMDAICEDNSYRSTVGAMDFTAALQAGMSSDRDYEWVERADLARVEAEFKLGGFGLIDRAEAIRSGRWVKADWGVFIRISTNGATGRMVWIEIVDLQRADLLAATNLTLAPRMETHFSAASEDMAKAALTLRLLLGRAGRAYTDSRGQVNVALLFLSRSGSGGGLLDLEERFRDVLAAAATNHPPLHLIQFQRPGAAMDEANLVLSGLAQTDFNAWEKVADQYIWGKYSVRENRAYNPETRQWNGEKGVDVTLNVWDGKSDPRVVTLSVTNAASSEGAARELAAMATPLLTPSAANSLGDGLRRKISESLATHAVQLARAAPPRGLNSREGQRDWLEVVQVLETACFFDPGNPAARELWARVRWGRRGAQASGNEFFFARRRSEAWRKHVEQFGFESVCPQPPRGWWETNSVAAEFVLSAWRPFEMFKFSQYEQARWGVPRDAGGKEIVGWQRQFAEDLFARLLAAPEDPKISAMSRDFLYGALAMNRDEFVLRDAQQRRRVLERLWPGILNLQREHPALFDEAYLRGLRLHFEQIGQPGGDQTLLAQLNEIAKSKTEKERSQPFQLPRTSELDGNTQQPKVRP